MVTQLGLDAIDAPHLALIDGADAGLDEAGLRTTARGLGAAVGASAVSRSYCHPYALVGWHCAPVGVDIEAVVPCPPEFAESISTPTEYTSGRWTTDSELVSLWSGKEALAKALGNAVDYDPRRLPSPAGWPGGICGSWRAATLALPDSHCVWVCWQASS
jgi:phosphopantetheinyl transferase